MLKDNLYIIILSVFGLVIGLDVIKLILLVKRPPLTFNLSRYLFRIHIIVLFLGVILTIVLIAFEVNIFKYSAPMEYNRHKEITLSNFDGFKIPGQTLQGGNRFAFITSNIEYGRLDNGVEIKSLFHPARSYVYIDDLQSDNLLTHELYHFHITEIWAREFRKEISKYNSLPTNHELDRLESCFFFRLNEMQRTYDYETDHSYLLGNQIRWQNKVDSTLKALAPFSDTFVRF